MITVESISPNGVLVRTVTPEPSDLSSDEQKQTWQSTCNSCEYRVEESCGQCGCLLLTIMTYNTAKCPIGKW